MADPSSTNAKRSSRFLIPRSVVDPRGSILAYAERPASTLYPFQAPQPASQSSQFDDDENPLTKYDTIDELKGDNASVLSGNDEEEQVLGSTEIFDQDGNIRLVPVGHPEFKLAG